MIWPRRRAPDSDGSVRGSCGLNFARPGQHLDRHLNGNHVYGVTGNRIRGEVLIGSIFTGGEDPRHTRPACEKPEISGVKSCAQVDKKGIVYGAGKYRNALVGVWCKYPRHKDRHN